MKRVKAVRLPKPVVMWAPWSEEDGVWITWAEHVKRDLLRELEYDDEADYDGVCRVLITPLPRRGGKQEKRK